MPLERRRAALDVERAAVEQEAVRDVVVVRVQLEAVAGRALAEDVPDLCRRIPVGLVRAARGVATRADVAEAEDVGDLALRVEGCQRGIRDRRRDRAVVALGLEPVVVEPRAHQLGAGDVVDVSAVGVRALAVAGELDLLVADARELLEHLAEARGQVGRVGVAGDRVANGVEDDAALARRDEDAVPFGRRVGNRVGGPGAERRGTEGGGRGHARRRREQLASAEAEAAPQLRIVVTVDEIAHNAPLHVKRGVLGLARRAHGAALRIRSSGARCPGSHRSPRSLSADGGCRAASFFERYGICSGWVKQKASGRD